MSTLPISQITIKGIQIGQVIIGEGKQVLLLHGWDANIGLMWPLAERLSPLGYRVYIPELPGFGGSETPPEAWSVFDYAKFMLLYMAHHDLDRVYLIGHSFGGRLGLILGADHPDRIVKMALANSAGVRPRTAFHRRARLTAYKFIRDSLNRLGMRTFADQLRHGYNRRYGSVDFQNADGVMRETFVRVVNEDLLPYAARVTVPTLLFWGDQDKDTPLWQGELLEKTIPDAGLIVHKGAGHYSYLDRLADTVRVMDYFFKSDE
jgi:pimeloyl-ACP methyl ester carboxylesterase